MTRVPCTEAAVGKVSVEASAQSVSNNPDPPSVYKAPSLILLTKTVSQSMIDRPTFISQCFGRLQQVSRELEQDEQ